MEKKGNVWALLPILVFLVLFVGIGIISGDFYAMPITVGFLIALIVAFMQNRKKTFDEKLSIMAKGAGEENIMIMCLIFILAGAFAGAVEAAGGVESTVNLGLSIFPARFAVAGLFIIGCFISISMGTSMGTIAIFSVNHRLPVGRNRCPIQLFRLLALLIWANFNDVMRFLL